MTDNADTLAHQALQDWAKWMLASDYPSMSICHPDKSAGIPGSFVGDSMVEMAAIRFYSPQIRIVHEVVMNGLSSEHRKFVECYYLAPEGYEPTIYTRDKMKLSRTRFFDLKGDVIMLVAMALRLRVPEMACSY